MARHSRRLAREILDEQTSRRLTEFAEELEAKAVAIDETAPQTFSHDEAVAVQKSEDDANS